MVPLSMRVMESRFSERYQPASIVADVAVHVPPQVVIEHVFAFQQHLSISGNAGERRAQVVRYAAQQV